MVCAIIYIGGILYSLIRYIYFNLFDKIMLTKVSNVVSYRQEKGIRSNHRGGKAMTTTINYQNHTTSLVTYWRNGRLFQSISYNIRSYVAQILNIAYYQEG